MNSRRQPIDPFVKFVTHLETNMLPQKGGWEDDFPLPQVGYGLVPWRVEESTW